MSLPTRFIVVVCEIAKFVHSTIYNRISNLFCCYFLKSTEQSFLALRQSADNTHPNIFRYHAIKLSKYI